VEQETEALGFQDLQSSPSLDTAEVRRLLGVVHELSARASVGANFDRLLPRSICGMISDRPVVTVQSQEFAVLVQKVATEVKPIPNFSKVQDA